MTKESIIIDRNIRISTVGRDDYPELEGKIIDYKMSDGIIDKGIVIGCNRSVGITIVNVQDKDDYLVCFSGPVTKGGGSDFSDSPCTWYEMFDALVAGIKAGKLLASELLELRTGSADSMGTCSSSECAYRQ